MAAVVMAAAAAARGQFELEDAVQEEVNDVAAGDAGDADER